MGTTVQKPDPSRTSTSEQFLEELQRLRTWAGRPSYRRLKELAGARTAANGDRLEALPTTTTWEILSGKRLPQLPRLDFVESFVAACMAARRSEPEETEREVERWRQSWLRLAGVEAGGQGESAPEGSREGSVSREGEAGPPRPGGPPEKAGMSARAGISDLVVAGPPIPSPRSRARQGRQTTAIVALVCLAAGVVAATWGDRVLGTPEESPTGLADQLGMEEDLVLNGRFERTTTHWWTHRKDADGNQRLPLEAEDGRLRVEVPGNAAAPWHMLVGQSGIRLREGAHYILALEYSASDTVPVRVRVQQEREPYPGTLEKGITLEPETHQLAIPFTSVLGVDNAQVIFQLGGHPEDFVAEFDNVSLIEVPFAPRGLSPATVSPATVSPAAVPTGTVPTGTVPAGTVPAATTAR